VNIIYIRRRGVQPLYKKYTKETLTEYTKSTYSRPLLSFSLLSLSVKTRGWRVIEGGVFWWLTFFMATVRSWFVESKEFDMLIKGGNLGLRIVERSNKKQGTIFILRDELAWLVDAVEEVVDVDSSEVFWDQSRAGCPRIFVQRRSNRHGRFITIEEFEGRNRRGSILIPEGRHGQGWTRLISELRTARMSLWKDRVFRERKVEKVDSGKRSFVEVVGGSKSTKAMEGSVLAKTCGGRVQTHHSDEAGEHSGEVTPSDCYDSSGGRGIFRRCAGEAAGSN
jgi:hypothetical protein